MRIVNLLRKNINKKPVPKLLLKQVRIKEHMLLKSELRLRRVLRLILLSLD